jgi:hypothetical protein
MQTHLSEQTDEIAWVKELFPEARDYLDTYEAVRASGPGGALRPRDPPDRASAPAERGRCQPDPLPDLEHLHRIGAFRHGGPDGRGPADRAGHRHRRRVVVFDAAHHGRGLRDRAAARHRAAPGAAALARPRRARHGRCGPTTRSAISPRDGGRHRGARPRLDARHFPARRPGRGHLGGGVPHDHDGRRPGRARPGPSRLALGDRGLHRRVSGACPAAKRTFFSSCGTGSNRRAARWRAARAHHLGQELQPAISPSPVVA